MNGGGLAAGSYCIRGGDRIALRAVRGVSPSLGPASVSEEPVPDWYVRGFASSILNSTPGVYDEVMRLPHASDALHSIAEGNPDQRKLVADALVNFAIAGEVEDEPGPPGTSDRFLQRLRHSIS